MSKEKIIGLSVIGILATTLTGVGAWRFLGDHGPALEKGEPAASVSDETAQAGSKAETGPTVLASATDSGNTALADRLSGKTKVTGSWNTADAGKASSAAPALPSGNPNYLAGNSGETTLRTSVGDEEPHPSYMPKEPASLPSDEANLNVDVQETAPGRYGTEDTPTQDIVDAANPADADLSTAPTQAEGPYSSSIADTENALPDGDVTDSYAAMSSRVPAAADPNEVIQIVEAAPPATLNVTSEVDPVAEQLARRAADEARFAEAYSRVEEAVQIPEGVVENSSAADLSPSQAADLNTEPAAPARFKADTRFASDARYAGEASSALAVNENETAEPSSSAGTSSSVGTSVAATPRSLPAATPTAGEAPYAPGTAEPGYRESVYRDRAVTSNTQAAPASSAPAGSSSGALTTQSGGANAYAPTARMSSMSNAASNSAMGQDTAPMRENTGKYYVEPGDSFWIIAQKVYGSGGFFKALQEHNRARFLNPSDMQVGDEVLTPSETELRERYSGLCPKQRVAMPGSPAAKMASHTPQHTAGMTKYEVQEGDTLYDIARYELGNAQRWPEIFQLNRNVLGVDIDYVKPGTMLVLPTDAPLDNSPQAERSEDTLTRRPGDNLQR